VSANTFLADFFLAFIGVSSTARRGAADPAAGCSWDASLVCLSGERGASPAGANDFSRKICRELVGPIDGARAVPYGPGLPACVQARRPRPAARGPRRPAHRRGVRARRPAGGSAAGVPVCRGRPGLWRGPSRLRASGSAAGASWLLRLPAAARLG
jgi:hypothetical protein